MGEADAARESGFLNLNKPVGITSHDVVAELRRILGQKKIGHSGTLDVPASGVLVMGLGKATRLLKYITALPKKYTAELIFGSSTDTGDDTGEVVAESEPGDGLKNPDAADFLRVAKTFTGKISQIPPMFSAKKIQGQRLYEMANRGETVEREPQEVEIYDLQISRLNPQPKKGEADEIRETAEIKVECSMGTYIRTLGYDIAKALGSEGHIKNLQRLSVGHFDIKDAVNLDELLAEKDSASPRELALASLTSSAEGMKSYMSCEISDSSQIDFLKNGRSIPLPQNLKQADNKKNHNPQKETKDLEICCALNPEGELAAVCEVSGLELKPKVVLI